MRAGFIPSGAVDAAGFSPRNWREQLVCGLSHVQYRQVIVGRKKLLLQERYWRRIPARWTAGATALAPRQVPDRRRIGRCRYLATRCFIRQNFSIGGKNPLL